MKVVVVARKPLVGTVASNVVKHGCGGLNIDASRIGTSDSLNGGAYAENPTHRAEQDMWTSQRTGDTNCFRRGKEHAGEYEQPTGRWPANLILQHFDGCRCDGVKKVKANQSSTIGSGKGYEETSNNGVFNAGKGGVVRASTADADGNGNETITNWICEPGCPVARLDEQSDQSGSNRRSSKGTGLGYGSSGHGERGSAGYNDTGGASRFYKQVKP